MIAEELINHMIPPLKLNDDAHKAMLWMEELRSNQLPVVDKEKFLGLISEEMILEENDVEKLIGDFQLQGTDCQVTQGSHFYDILKLASDNQVQMVGVVNDANEYIGVISIQDTITSFAQTAAVQMAGGILVISMNLMDYSLAELSRLIEEENSKILSCSVKEDDLDASKIKLTIKINKTDLSHIVATLERFGYKIIARFQEPNINKGEKEKLDQLLKFLDI
ncbi:MAG: CBS domain-containing protein [Cyclobacteriaceae bacterium]|nr:CBS domain-containing protein [Cyclobacteriaceae bacterium]